MNSTNEIGATNRSACCQSLRRLTLPGWFGALALVILTFISTAYSQQYRGTINGTVTDQTGAAVAGARVQVIDDNTHFVSPAITNGQGLYSAPFLTPGTYEVKVSATGFASAIQTGVVLIASDTKQVDFKLSPGRVNASVTVTANQQLLQTESATIGSVISSNELHNAPLIDGNPYMMATRVAGVYSNFTQNTESTQWIPVGGGASGTAFNGIGGDQLVTMDGIVTTIPEGNPGSYTGYIPPSIAVQELNVETSAYDAEIGRTYGGVENTVLKTGTEKLYGEASFLYGDTIFNSNTYQRTALGQPRNDLIWSQPSFVVTGPVRIPGLNHGHAKTFFMVAYQHIQYTLSSATSFTGNVPTAKERNGDFSELLRGTGNTGVIYDPTTTYTGGPQPAWCAGNCAIGQRESFTQEYGEGPGGGPANCNGDINCIPASRFNATGVNLLNYSPQPTGMSSTPGVGNFSPVTGLSNPSWMWMAAFSIDHEFNENNKLTVAFLPYVWNAANANEDFPYVNGYSGGPGYPQTSRKQWGGLIDYTKVISPTLVLNIRSGGFYHPFVIPRPGDNIDLSKLGFTGGTLSFPHPNFPAVSAAGPFANYTSLNSGASYYEYSSLVDNSVILSKSFQRHNVKAGFNYSLYRTDPQGPVSSFASNSTPLAFNTAYTNSNPNSGTGAVYGGDGIASLLLGYPSSGSATIIPAPAYEWDYWAAFVQDDWRLTDNLTLNLGLRWDYMSPYTERHNRLEAGFDFSSNQPFNLPNSDGTGIASSIAPPASSAVPQGYHGGLEFVSSSNRLYYNRELGDRWQPRIGVAWHVFPNTVLRGGYAIFFAPNYPSPQNTGFSSSTDIIASPNGKLTPAKCTAAQGADAYGFCNISNPYPNGYVKPTGSLLGLSTSLGSSITFNGPAWVPFKDNVWSAGIEQQLPFQMMVDIEYHGSNGNGIGISKNWNALPNCYYYGGGCPNAGNVTALNAAVANPMHGYLPATSALNAATLPQDDLYLPYPEFGAITQSNDTVIDGTHQRLGGRLYNALYVTFTKRASHGLEGRLAGTWAHIEDTSTLLNAADPVTDAIKFDDSQPNLYLVGDLVWNLPRLNVNHALGSVVNGWTWSHSLNWQNGTTISVPGGAFSTGVSPVTHHRSLTHWFNTCYIPVVPNGNVGQTLNGVVNKSPVYGPPTNCQFGEQPAWIQQPTGFLNRLNGNPMRGVRLQEVPYYDMALMKSIPIRESVSFQFRVEAHNVFNNALIGQGPNTSLTSSAFGTNSPAATVNGKSIYTQVNDPRIVRFEARLSF